MTHTIEQIFHYGTVSEAINNFKEQGYTIDFNLKENCFSCSTNNDKYKLEDFEIVELYQYEGGSGPSEEATIYALKSRSGLKGILVAGYGIYLDPDIEKKLGDLHYRI